MASRTSSSGIAPPMRSVFQPDRPMYAITDASSGYRCSHSSATSRFGPHLSPTDETGAEPRKAKILEPTFTTTSPSHGSSCHAPGLPRQYLNSSSYVTPLWIHLELVDARGRVGRVGRRADVEPDEPARNGGAHGIDRECLA